MKKKFFVLSKKTKMEGYDEQSIREEDLLVELTERTIAADKILKSIEDYDDVNEILKEISDRRTISEKVAKISASNIREYMAKSLQAITAVKEITLLHILYQKYFPDSLIEQGKLEEEITKMSRKADELGDYITRSISLLYLKIFSEKVNNQKL